MLFKWCHMSLCAISGHHLLKCNYYLLISTFNCIKKIWLYIWLFMIIKDITSSLLQGTPTYLVNLSFYQVNTYVGSLYSSIPFLLILLFLDSTSIQHYYVLPSFNIFKVCIALASPNPPQSPASTADQERCFHPAGPKLQVLSALVLISDQNTAKNLSL